MDTWATTQIVFPIAFTKVSSFVMSYWLLDTGSYTNNDGTPIKTLTQATSYFGLTLTNVHLGQRYTHTYIAVGF